MKFKTILVLLFILTVGFDVYSQKPKRAQTQKNSPTFSAEHISSQNRGILQNWLAGKSGWRPAVENDAYSGQTKQTREFIKSEIQAMTNHPFYIAADFNKDGKPDFAVMLVKKVGKKNKFAVAIFNGVVSQRKVAPAFYTESVESGDFLFWRTGDEFGNRILVGPPSSDSGYSIVPRGKTYIID